MDPQSLTLWAALGGVLTGAGGVLGYLAKRGLSNGKGNPGGDLTLGAMLVELRTLNQNLTATALENRESHRRIEERQVSTPP